MNKVKSFFIKALYFIVLVALLEPTYLAKTPLHSILGLMKYLAFAVAIPMTFYYKLYKSKSFLLLTGIIVWIGIASLTYSGNLSDTFLYNTRIMFAIIVFGSVGAKTMPRFFVGSTATIYAAWLFLQGVTWKPNGLFINAAGQINFFLGTKTSMTYYLIPGLLFVLVFLEISKKQKPRYSWLLLFATVIGSTLYLARQSVSTAILCSLLLAVGIFVVEKYPRCGKFVMKYGFLITSVLCVLFIYNIIQEMFSFIIVDMLNESIEMNGRTQIWEQVLSYIYKRPIFGYGYSSGIRFDVWQDYNTSAHNFYLFLVFSGGLVGLGLFFSAIHSIHKKLVKKLNYRIVRYVLLTLIVINIECITEVCCFNAMYFSVLALAFNIDYILPGKKKRTINLDMDLN